MQEPKFVQHGIWHKIRAFMAPVNSWQNKRETVEVGQARVEEQVDMTTLIKRIKFCSF